MKLTNKIYRKDKMFLITLLKIFFGGGDSRYFTWFIFIHHLQVFI